jgi:hypothetical protein
MTKSQLKTMPRVLRAYMAKQPGASGYGEESDSQVVEGAVRECLSRICREARQQTSFERGDLHSTRRDNCPVSPRKVDCESTVQSRGCVDRHLLRHGDPCRSSSSLHSSFSCQKRLEVAPEVAVVPGPAPPLTILLWPCQRVQYGIAGPLSI